MNAFWRFLRDKRNQQVLGCREALKERTRARVPLDNALVLPAGAHLGADVRVARRSGAPRLVADRLRWVLAVHAVQACQKGKACSLVRHRPIGRVLVSSHF